MDTTLNLVVIRAANLDESRRFYEALGLQFTAERHGTGPEHLAATLGDVVFEIYPRNTSAVTTGVRLGFRVTSIADVLSEVEQRKGKIVSPAADSEWGRRAVVADPDGHKIELSQTPNAS